METLQSIKISPQAQLQNQAYTYDTVGNILTIVDGKNSNQTQCFNYDTLNRLMQALTGYNSTGGCTYTATGNGPYHEQYTYNSSTGNLQSKTVRDINGTYTTNTYGYNDSAHVHAVTHLNGVQKYWYDANGNQVTRTVGGVTHTLTYDGENRLIEVKKNSATIATFVYNGDGERVKSMIGFTTTAFVSNYLEWTGSATTMKSYYYAGSTRVAMRTGSSTLNFILGDHLGSASVTTSSTGTSPKYQLYKPFGEVRYTSGTLPTKYTFTGQYSNVSDFGLMYYGARWYDVSLGRFASADTIIPGAGNPLAWDRFAYSNNNPIKYIDPDGHFPWVPVLIGGAIIGGGIIAYIRYQQQDAINNNPELNRQSRDQIGGALVTELTEVVTQKSSTHNVPSTLINAVIRHESGAFERRYFGNGFLADAAEYGEATVRSLTDQGASIGIGQLQTGLAKELEEKGYVNIPGKHDITASLLTPSLAVEYIAGNLQYLTDNLTSTYGNDFSRLGAEEQNRLILIGYNLGWENLKKNIDDNTFWGVIEDSGYDNQTLDEYNRWAQVR